MNRKIYIAYGSNLNIRQMKYRCPKAKIIGSYILEGYKLEFRGVANIIPDKYSKVPIGLWEITEECEKALDIYEGYPKLYRKEYIELEINGVKEIGMVYIMNYKGVAPPSEYYYNVIKKGYKDFGIDEKTLKRALEESKKYKVK